MPAVEIPVEPLPPPSGQPRASIEAWWIGTSIGVSSWTTRFWLRNPIRVLTAASGVLNWCDVGTWQAEWVVAGTGEIPAKGSWMLFRVDGETLASGPITECTASSSETPGVITVQVRGVTEESVLADRRIFPDPSRWEEIQTTQSHDRRSGLASTVMMGYARDHTSGGDPAYGQPTRALGQLAIAPDPMLGPTISMAERWTGLLDTLQRAALKSGLGFRVTRPIEAPGQAIFEVVAPRDRSGGVVFTDRSLDEWSWTWKAPTATSVIAAGQGELTARMVAAENDTAAMRLWQRRIEQFRDQRAEADIAQLRSDNTAAMDDAREQESVTVQPSAALPFRYGSSWRLGDTVRAVVGVTDRPSGATGDLVTSSRGVKKIVAQVTQVKWSVDRAGVARFSPVIGSGGEVDLTGATARALSRRLNNIEGAQ